MAAIDKTYLTYDEYLVLKEWCKNTELIYDNGIKGSPMDFLFSYNDFYDRKMPVWNTPESFDRWLYHNCPLSFIQQRLKEQYSNPEIYFNEPIETKERGRHYSIISIPKVKIRTKGPWFIEMSNSDYYYYGFDSKIWYSFDSLMPSETRCCGHACIYNLTKRKLNRLISKWNLPIGSVLIIGNKYIGSEFKIKIKR